MSRNLSSNTVTALAQPVVLPIVFVEVLFTSGALRVHSGYGSLTLNGNTFTGAGAMLGVSSITENADLASNGATFSLAGIDPAFIAAFLQEHYQGRSVKAWLAFFAADGSGALLSDPYEFFTGRLDTATITEDGTTATISAEAESELIDLERSRARRYTHEGMRQLYPSEMGFEYVEGLENRALLWGKVYRPGEEGYWKRSGHWYMKNSLLHLAGHGPTLAVGNLLTGSDNNTKKILTLGMSKGKGG